MHTTNYAATLILPSEDCRATESVAPPKPGTVAALQYDLIADAPYAMTSDDVLVAVTAQRRDIPADEYTALRDEIFSKGQPCLRASPLVKTYGWAVHHDAQCRVALIAQDDPRLAALIADGRVTKVHGMRSRKE